MGHEIKPLKRTYGSGGACDVLVLVAHPDDAELLCGGTLAKLSEAGRRVTVVDATEAELSTNGSVESRRRETLVASDCLQLHSRYQLGYGDGELSTTATLLESLTLAIRELRPKLVIGPPLLCRHPDHQALGQMMAQAVFFSGLKKKWPQLGAVQRPKLWRFVEVSDEPYDVAIDISEFWERRVQAVMAYGSQFSSKDGERTFINDGFLERLECRYRHIGEQVGVRYAEPFITGVPTLVDLPTDTCSL
jgi:bacillithiol biosynthesis deacetylase BshB1